MSINVTNYFAYPDLNGLFGFPVLQNIAGDEEKKRVAFVKTAVNIVDYLPVIGQICGVARLALAGYACYKVFFEGDRYYTSHINTPQKNINLVQQAARGLVRAMGFRMALFVQDLIVGIEQLASQVHNREPAD